MDKEKIMKILITKKSELESLINRVSSEEMVESDSWKMVNEIGDEAMEGQELLSKQEKLDNLQNMLRRTEQAMEDLNSGRYGICNRCEEEIDEDRLTAHPHAQYCFKCQSLVDDQEE